MEDDKEMQLAAELATIFSASNVTVPVGTHVAIFVFREIPELQHVNIAYVSAAPLKTLRRWLKFWRRATSGYGERTH